MIRAKWAQDLMTLENGSNKVLSLKEREKKPVERTQGSVWDKMK